MRQNSPIVLSILLFLGIQYATYSQTLNPGELAVTTFNKDGANSFSFLTFVDLPPGTVLHFTDFGWDTVTNAFSSSNEGTITWTTTTEIKKLTEIIFNNVSSGVLTVSKGSASKNGNFNISASGDQLLVYQDPKPGTTIPNFIYLFNRGSSIVDNKSGIRSSPTQTMLPSGLTEGINMFVTTSNLSNWQFKCNNTKSGNKESLLMCFIDESNYNSNSSSTQAYENGALSQNGCNIVLNTIDSTKPIIYSQSLFIREDAANKTPIGTPMVFDPVATSFKNWKIVGGKDQNIFNIDRVTGVLSVEDNSTFDFENLNTRNYIIEVIVEDNSGNISDINSSIGKGVITITIEDYKTNITISSTSPNVMEGQIGEFSFENEIPSLSPISFRLNFVGTATKGLDYTNPPMDIIIPANQRVFTLPIPTITDALSSEANEVVQLAATLKDPNEDISTNSIASFIITNDPNSSLGIADIILTQNLKVYPNPGNGILHIQSNSTSTLLENAELYTLQGKLVKSLVLNTIEHQTIDISDVAIGTYILKIHSSNATAVLKIIRNAK